MGTLLWAAHFILDYLQLSAFEEFWRMNVLSRKAI